MFCSSATIKYLDGIVKFDKIAFASGVNLLGHLIECFEFRVVVLDALDGCPEEVHRDLLRGLLSVMRKERRPHKVFIASSHSLDIEDNLWDLPHICIEAKDNGQDIEKYVRQ